MSARTTVSRLGSFKFNMLSREVELGELSRRPKKAFAPKNFAGSIGGWNELE